MNLQHHSMNLARALLLGLSIAGLPLAAHAQGTAIAAGRDAHVAPVWYQHDRDDGHHHDRRRYDRHHDKRRYDRHDDHKRRYYYKHDYRGRWHDHDRGYYGYYGRPYGYDRYYGY